MSPREALAIAVQRGKDLIEVVPNATPPVCKIMDFGKFKYEIQKKEKLQMRLFCILVPMIYQLMLGDIWRGLPLKLRLQIGKWE